MFDLDQRDINKRISLIALKHNDWKKITKGYGAKDYSEDLVQDMYLRLMEKPKYLLKATDGYEVQDGYVFFMLRTMLINKQNKDTKDNVFIIADTFSFLEDIDNGEELEEKLGLEYIYEKIQELIDGWRWYDRKIFEIYRDTELSIRGIAAYTHIPYYSIFETLKRGKQEVLKHLWKEWYEFKKGNYGPRD